VVPISATEVVPDASAPDEAALDAVTAVTEDAVTEAEPTVETEPETEPPVLLEAEPESSLQTEQTPILLPPVPTSDDTSQASVERGGDAR
jgi:hypothetical protein